MVWLSWVTVLACLTKFALFHSILLAQENLLWTQYCGPAVVMWPDNVTSCGLLLVCYNLKMRQVPLITYTVHIADFLVHTTFWRSMDTRYQYHRDYCCVLNSWTNWWLNKFPGIVWTLETFLQFPVILVAIQSDPPVWPDVVQQRMSHCRITESCVSTDLTEFHIVIATHQTGVADCSIFLVT